MHCVCPLTNAIVVFSNVVSTALPSIVKLTSSSIKTSIALRTQATSSCNFTLKPQTENPNHPKTGSYQTEKYVA